MEPTIALVFSPEPWVERLHRHLTDHGGARVRDIVLEPTLALQDDYDALVVSHRWPGLTRAFIDAVHARGRCVLGVFDVDEPAGRAHLLDLGADSCIDADASVRDFVDALVALAPSAVTPPRRGATATATSSTTPRGATVVSGPAGAGATEIALALAAAVAARGETAVLVDADEFTASIATRAGLAIEPNLRHAIDAVEHGLGDLASTLVSVGRPAFHVVCGLPSATAAAQVRPRDVDDVVAALGQLYTQVIVDAAYGPASEIGRAVVAVAGAIVGVGLSNPVGVTRLLAWLAGLPAGAAPVHVALNRAPADRYQRAELTAELYHTFTPASLSFVPADRRVDQAAWAGELVSRGAFVKSVGYLAQAAIPRGARQGRALRRGRRARSAA